MAEHSFTRLEAVDYLHRFFVSLDSQGLDCVQLILDATARASTSIPSLRCFCSMTAMLANLKTSLVSVAHHERQSGVYHALLGSVLGQSVEAKDLCLILGVDRRTAKKSVARLRHATDQLQHTGHHSPIVQKPVIKRVRIPQQLLQRIEAFFLDHCSPSADKTKVKRKRLRKGSYTTKPIMYRTTTMPRLLAEYRVCPIYISLLLFFEIL